MKKSNTISFNALFKLIALLCANGAIVIALMHLVFHFIDLVNYSVAFLDSNVTHALIFILSIFSAITAIYVLYSSYLKKNKGYFSRKVAFITLWICVINILIQKNWILPNLVEAEYRETLWFFISIFTMINSIYCNGLLCMKASNE